MRCKQRQQDGFTLLEILVTLSIVAIVAALAVPSLSGILGNSEVSATSNHLVYSLQSARSEAIKRVTPVGLCPSAKPLSTGAICDGKYTDGWIVYVDANGNGKRESTEELLLQSEPLSSAFSVVPDTRFAKGILFSIAGISINVAGIPISGNIEVRHANGEGRTVDIAASGRIAVANSDAYSSADTSVSATATEAAPS